MDCFLIFLIAFLKFSDELYRVDDAMMAGFGWEIGAFESWDVMGVETTVTKMKAAGYTVAPWVEEMIAAGNKTFYKVENGKKFVITPVQSNTYHRRLPGGADAFIVMRNFENQTSGKTVAAEPII